jgi:hypothetical protein
MSEKTLILTPNPKPTNKINVPLCQACCHDICWTNCWRNVGIMVYIAVAILSTIITGGTYFAYKNQKDVDPAETGDKDLDPEEFYTENEVVLMENVFIITCVFYGISVIGFNCRFRFTYTTGMRFLIFSVLLFGYGVLLGLTIYTACTVEPFLFVVVGLTGMLLIYDYILLRPFFGSEASEYDRGLVEYL